MMQSLWILVVFLSLGQSFVPQPRRLPRDPSLYIFRRKDDEGGRRFQGILDKLKRKKLKKEPETVTATLEKPTDSSTTPKSTTSSTPGATSKTLTPAELKAQAERTRLEAERLEAELTLAKINRIEKQLTKARAKDDNAELLESLEREMEVLVAKMKGESVPKKQPPPPPKTNSNKEVSQISRIVVVPPKQEDYEDLVQLFEESPNFMKKALATQVEMDIDVEQINATEVALRLEQMNRLDFSYSKRPAPKFTSSEIEAKLQQVKANKLGVTGNIEKRMKEIAGANQTQLALLSLEYDYYTKGTLEISDEQLAKIAEGEEWLQSIVEAVNKSALDNSIETLYPKSTRKEGQQPTLAQVQKLVTDVLPKTSFKATSKPEQVAGGFIIRGTTKADKGDKIIDEIDALLEKSSLKEKMTVLYTRDFSIFSSDSFDGDATFDPDSMAPILYVTGPDLVRESKPVQLSVVTAIGLATTWYLSLYPFLFNPDIAKRVDEQLALADANMSPDLSWLTDLSIPLFTTFIAIQILHDLAHRIVAAAYDFKTTPPTFVPSIITGLTSTVTSFRSLPKNKQEMFDYSVAGPLAGMLASLAAIVVGTQLTVSSDASMFPALPLVILRQSTLGGGIIDGILGSGALSVPEGAIGTAAVAGMTVPLHPVAVAGYISLLVNALNVLPIGTTDGGRMALTLFGRGAKLLIGNIALFTAFLAGFSGSDLFLFYFAFCLAFQAGNEVPSRNEVDGVEFSRVLVATTAYVIAALALIPFQS